MEQSYKNLLESQIREDYDAGMPKYPIYLDLVQKRTVVIGAGTIAARKVKSLADAGARVVVIAPETDSVFESICSSGNVTLVADTYKKEYLNDAVLAIASTNDMDLNRRIYADCQSLEILCNIVDQPELCDFYVPAVIRRGPLQIAISTDGYCPAFSGHLRRKIDDWLSPQLGAFVETLEQVRRHIMDTISDPDRRKTLLGYLANDESMEVFIRNGSDAWRNYANEILQSNHSD
jgi:precorrin-2 dehydrogenase/sirohydrochlorin ferrochelatase